MRDLFTVLVFFRRDEPIVVVASELSLALSLRLHLNIHSLQCTKDT